MPIFKKNLDLQTNQLLNAVLHKLPVMPNNPVEGQMYYDTGKGTAYIWNGTNWAVWGDPNAGQQTNQYMLNIPNPPNRSGFAFVKLYQNQEVLRIDAHTNDGIIGFNIESRQYVNIPGDTLTHDPLQATIEGTETVVFTNSSLPADNWLYIEIIEKEGTIAILTITVTCTTV